MSPPPETRRHPGHVSELLTAGAVTACYYASGDARRAAARPDCGGLASVIYGPIALCASYDLRRSAVGKATPPRHLADPAAIVGLRPAQKPPPPPPQPSPTRSGKHARPGIPGRPSPPPPA